MRFGVYSSIADPPAGENIARCVDEVMEEAQSAEEFGFEAGPTWTLCPMPEKAISWRC